jgi:peptidoglycan/LPS O-acetylase OafA/YrhL
VCLGHVCIAGQSNGWFHWAKFVFYPLDYAQEAVYLFFILSGFSIHYSSHGRSLGTIRGIANYYYLRFRRIYPIFLFAIGLAVGLGALTSWLDIPSIAPCKPSAKDLSFVFLFLTDVHNGGWHIGLPNDPALWSLSYEIPYYLVYPLFWRCSKHYGAGRIFLASVLASCGFMVAGCLHFNHVSNIFSLYWLWTCGALMAEWKLYGKRFILSPIIYYFALYLAFAASQALEATAPELIVHWSSKAAVVGMVVFASYGIFRPIRLSDRILAIAAMMLILALSLIVTQDLPTWGRHIFLNTKLIFASVGISGLLMTGVNVSSIARAVVRPFLKAGPISYALYVIHLPIWYFLADLLRHNGIPTYCMTPALVPIIALAWCLEIPFQRYVSRWLDAGRERVATILMPRLAVTR